MQITLLLFEKLRVQDDVLGGYRWISQLPKQIFSVIKAERIVKATVVQFFSFIRIDVVHHQEDILLCQIIIACPYGQDAPDQLMVDLAGAFLVRTALITVKDICPVQGYFSPLRYSICLGFENSLPLLVRITGNSLLKYWGQGLRQGHQRAGRLPLIYWLPSQRQASGWYLQSVLLKGICLRFCRSRSLSLPLLIPGLLPETSGSQYNCDPTSIYIVICTSDRPYSWYRSDGGTARFVPTGLWVYLSLQCHPHLTGCRFWIRKWHDAPSHVHTQDHRSVLKAYTLDSFCSRCRHKAVCFFTQQVSSLRSGQYWLHSEQRLHL